MIYTVTLNPAIDKTIYVDDFKTNAVNRISIFRNDPGGKGINVSKMIQNLGGESEAITLVGGSTGAMLESLMDHEQVKYKSFRCSDETRINTKMVDKVNNQFTDINEPGPSVSKKLIGEMEAYLGEVLAKGDTLILSGSVPRGVPKDIYKTWSILGKKQGAKVILDADNELFVKGIEGAPFMIKPNEKELATFFGQEELGVEAMPKLCQQFFAKGIEVVLVSLGPQGCLLVTKNKSIRFEAIDVPVKSTVGAGDSMVAGVAYEFEDLGTGDYSEEDLIRAVSLGISASSASVEQEGTIMGHKDRIMELKRFIKYTELI